MPTLKSHYRLQANIHYNHHVKYRYSLLNVPVTGATATVKSSHDRKLSSTTANCLRSPPVTASMTRRPCPQGCLQKNGRKASHSPNRCPKLQQNTTIVGAINPSTPSSQLSTTSLLPTPPTPLEQELFNDNPFDGLLDSELAELDSLIITRNQSLMSITDIHSFLNGQNYNGPPCD